MSRPSWREGRETDMNHEYDIIIVGGGMVGASLAHALAASDYRIALLEAHAVGRSGQPSYDERTVALSYGSVRTFKALGLWDELKAFATPIKHIHVSERGRFGATRISHTEQGVEALGYVVINRALGECLYAQVSKQKNITIIMPARLRDFTVDPERVTVTVAPGPEAGEGTLLELHGRLLVAADGSASMVREQAGMQVRSFNYGHTAIVANVTPEHHHKYIAYERFTDTGPLALLPISQGRCSLVWSNREQDVDALLGLSDSEFLSRLQHRFGYRMGRLVKTGARSAYPLTLIEACEMVGPRLALLGNAAHSIHPVAGQGFNLALRDVATLAQLLVDGDEQDAGSEVVLNEFARWRRDDLRKTIRLTDALARVFTNPLVGMTHAGGLGLVVMDLIAPLRRMFARRTMGMAGRLPRLAVGQALRRPSHQGTNES